MICRSGICRSGSRRLGFAGIVIALVCLAAGSACTSATATSPGPAMFTDFATLNPPDSPNTWLIAPAGVSPVPPDEDAPRFDVPAAVVAKGWIAVVNDQPRTKILAVSEDGLQVEAEQSTTVFGFVDLISARFMPLADGGSTLAVYSRSQIGYWDLGVNRNRLRRWIDALRAKLASKP